VGQVYHGDESGILCSKQNSPTGAGRSVQSMPAVSCYVRPCLTTSNRAFPDSHDIGGSTAFKLHIFCGVGRYVAPGTRFWLGMRANGPRRHIIPIKGFAGTASVRRRPSSVWGNSTADLASCKRLRLHFQIHFRVNIYGVERDVPQPGTDGVDVDARPEKMGCRRVPNRMRAHSFVR